MATISKAKPTEYYIEDTLILASKAPAYEISSMIRSLDGIKSDSVKTEKMMDIYLDLIIKYTDLDNSKEELKEFLSFDQLMELGDLVSGTADAKSKATFTKAK